MSITAETAKAHAKDPAVLCCRAEGGITIEPANLEDPAIFDELVDSGLLNLEDVLQSSRYWEKNLQRQVILLSTYCRQRRRNQRSYRRSTGCGSTGRRSCSCSGSECRRCSSDCKTWKGSYFYQRRKRYLS